MDNWATVASRRMSTVDALQVWPPMPIKIAGGFSTHKERPSRRPQLPSCPRLSLPTCLICAARFDDVSYMRAGERLRATGPFSSLNPGNQLQKSDRLLLGAAERLRRTSGIGSN